MRKPFKVTSQEGTLNGESNELRMRSAGELSDPDFLLKGSIQMNEYADYRTRFDGLKNSVYMDYPVHVQMETFAKCNAACSFCVYPDIERAGELMSMSLIEKVIGDLREIPRSVEFQFSPLGVNEPFLDTRLFTILDLISSQLPNAQITLTSNASPITTATLRKLASYKLGYLWLSVVDYRKDIYEEKMKLPFSRTIERLEAIHEAVSNGELKTKVVVSRLVDGTEHDEKFRSFMNERFPLFEVGLWSYSNWLGATSNRVLDHIPDLPCVHWFEFRMDAKGIVQHCCMDGHSQYPWGNVNKESVLSIYKRYRNLRARVLSRRAVSPCNFCTLR
jgi:Radical SAM superfamily